jgi:hypothetical protein
MSPLNHVESLRRPSLLVSAAKSGAEHYCRKTALRRTLGGGRKSDPRQNLADLVALELNENEKRISHAADYSVRQHVEVLIAVIGEAQLCRASQNETIRRKRPA